MAWYLKAEFDYLIDVDFLTSMFKRQFEILRLDSLEAWISPKTHRKKIK